MEIGISIFSGIGFHNQVKYFKKYGINRTFVLSETKGFHRVMRLLIKHGIICETLHAPFNKINDMWVDDEALAGKMLNRLKDCVDKCARYNIPVAVVHLSSGIPMPEITMQGVKRYEELFNYAKEKGVKIALENQRFLENLAYFMDRYDYPGFCWDVGHEYGFTKNIRFMDLYGSRLCATHIHDNRCGVNTDDHLLPFDGKIDFNQVAKDIAKSGYEGTLMLEVGKNVSPGGEKVYKALSCEEYVSRAFQSIKRLNEMVEKYKQILTHLLKAKGENSQ